MSKRCEAIPCASVAKAQWGNGGWCFGHRRAKVQRPCDTICFCEIAKDGAVGEGTLITPDEAAAIIQGLAAVLHDVTVPAQARCRKTRCSERNTCQNAG